MDLRQVAAVLEKFGGSNLTATLVRLEAAVRGLTADDCTHVLSSSGVDRELLTAAAALKRLAGQINVSIHATGLLLCLPHILEPGERVEYVSPGAGNTGKDFDLETNIGSRSSSLFIGGADRNPSGRISSSRTSTCFRRALPPNASISMCLAPRSR